MRRILQSTRGFILSRALPVGLLASSAFAGAPASFIWNGGTGNWNVGANWVGGVVPPAGSVWEIDDGDPLASVCVINTTATISGAIIDADDRIRIANSQIFVGTGTITNNGVIRLDSTGGNTYLRPGTGLLTLTGGGTVEFSDSAANWIYKNSTGGAFTNVDNTIMGAGNVGWIGSPTAITNQAAGTIIANGVNLLHCDAGAGVVFTNDGLMKAESGGTLRLANTFENGSGEIQALDGSTVQLNGCTIRGGLLDAPGTGQFVTSATNSLLDGSVNTLENAGFLRVSNSRILLAQGTLRNTGTIRLDSSGADTYLRPTNQLLTLTGGGTVEFSDSAVNWIYKSAAGGALTNVDNTIMGAGNVGWFGSPTTFINGPAGTVIANGTQAMKLDGGTSLWNNQGALRATGAGGLTIANTFTTSGTVFVHPASKLVREAQDYVQTAGLTIIDGLFQAQTAAVDIDLQGGALQGTGTITSDVFNNAGSVEPGDSIGTLTVNGVYTQAAAAALLMELRGVTPTPVHDRLVVSGAITLGGTLSGVAVDEYAPAVGDRFPIVQHGTRSGGFTAFSAVGFSDATLSVRADYSAAGNTELVVVRVGDMNCDGVISVSDIGPFVIALTNPTQYPIQFPTCEIFNGDVNGDGAISVSDIGPFVALLTG